MTAAATAPRPAPGPDIYGKITPRLFTPPLITGPPGHCVCGECALTPDTSFGFDVIDFADNVLAHPLDPWQQFAVVHGGELLPDGRPRFRHLLLLVSRQNGKTEIPVVLSLFWQFVDCVPMILGTSTKLDYAKESLVKAVRLAETAPGLPPTKDMRRKWFRQANGEQESAWDDCRYKIAASNEEGGRSLTVHRLILDELRQHHDYSAWSASVPAGNAVRDFQVWALSNAGDVRSVVLNDKRAAALKFIETGQGDYRLGLLEWSAPDGSSPLDLSALAQANPNLGYRIDPDALLGEAQTALAEGGEALAKFKIECMCMNVPMLDAAISPEDWAARHQPGDLSAVRDRIAACLDVAPDTQHVTLTAAAVLDDDRVRPEIIASWTGPTATAEARRDLPGHLQRVRPRVLGWFPDGPAAAIAADLKPKPPARGKGPKTLYGVPVQEITAETTAVCMGFADLVTSDGLVHGGPDGPDPLMTAHVTSAEKLNRGGGWVFSRKGEGHCDAAWSVAGAVHLARTLPEPTQVGKPRIITAQRHSA